MEKNRPTPRKIIDKDFVKQFGNNLRKIREEKGITQKELADRIEVIETMQISKIERGITNTSISMVRAISKAMEIPISSLFEFDEN